MIQSMVKRVSNKVGSIVDSRKMLQKGNRFDKKRRSLFKREKYDEK